MYYLNTTNFYFINEPLFSCMGMYVYCSDSGSNLSTSGPQYPPLSWSEAPLVWILSGVVNLLTLTQSTNNSHNNSHKQTNKTSSWATWGKAIDG